MVFGSYLAHYTVHVEEGGCQYLEWKERLGLSMYSTSMMSTYLSLAQRVCTRQIGNAHCTSAIFCEYYFHGNSSRRMIKISEMNSIRVKLLTVSQ